jgi:hypothetical protein
MLRRDCEKATDEGSSQASGDRLLMRPPIAGIRWRPEHSRDSLVGPGFRSARRQRWPGSKREIDDLVTRPLAENPQHLCQDQRCSSRANKCSSDGSARYLKHAALGIPRLLAGVDPIFHERAVGLLAGGLLLGMSGRKAEIALRPEISAISDRIRPPHGKAEGVEATAVEPGEVRAFLWVNESSWSCSVSG